MVDDLGKESFAGVGCKLSQVWPYEFNDLVCL